MKHKISKNTVFGIVLIIGGIIAQTYKAEQVNLLHWILCALVCAIAWGSARVFLAPFMESELSEIEALLIRQVTSVLVLFCDCALLISHLLQKSMDKLLGLMIVFAALI